MSPSGPSTCSQHGSSLPHPFNGKGKRKEGSERMGTRPHPVKPTLDPPRTRDMPSGHPFSSFPPHPAPLSLCLQGWTPTVLSLHHVLIRLLHHDESLRPCLPVVDHVQIGHQGQGPWIQ